PPPASEPGPLPAWLGLGLSALAVALVCVFSLQMLFASRLPAAKSRPVTQSRVADKESPEVDFSGEGILIVEYGGKTEPETGESSASDSDVEPSASTALELDSTAPDAPQES